MWARPNILLLSSDREERETVEGVIGEYATLTSVDGIREAEWRLRDGFFDACLCSWAFHQISWNDALARIRSIHPELPVIVLSRTGGEKEWLEVLDAGAFDLLAAPYRAPAVMAMLEQAVSSHESVLTGAHAAAPLHAKAS